MHFDMGLTKIKQIAGAHCCITNNLFINIVRKNPLPQLRNLIDQKLLCLVLLLFSERRIT